MELDAKPRIHKYEFFVLLHFACFLLHFPPVFHLHSPPHFHTHLYLHSWCLLICITIAICGFWSCFAELSYKALGFCCDCKLKHVFFLISHIGSRFACISASFLFNNFIVLVTCLNFAICARRPQSVRSCLARCLISLKICSFGCKMTWFSNFLAQFELNERPYLLLILTFMQMESTMSPETTHSNFWYCKFSLTWAKFPPNLWHKLS